MDPIAFRTLGGTGPDCLLIHGFGSDRLSWLGNTPALQPVAKVHALDLPGHGESGLEVGDGTLTSFAEQIAAVMDAHNLPAVHIVAHSLGSGIGLMLAARRPDLVASLALIAPAGLGSGVNAEFLKAYPEATDADTVMSLLRQLVVRPQLMGKQIAQRVLDQLARPGARQALRRIASQLSASEDAIHREAMTVAARGIPRLVLWGAEDRINPIDQSRLARFGGEQHVIAATGHLPHIENPKAVNGLLADFLARVIARA